MPASTAAQAFKEGLEAAVRAAVGAADPAAPVSYDWGEPDTWADDCVLFMRVSSELSPGPLSPQRGRDETLTCEVHIITRRSEQRWAELRGYQLLGWIEHRVRMVDPTLGGAVMWCQLTGHDADGFTPDADRAGGRGCEIIATFTARVRITN